VGRHALSLVPAFDPRPYPPDWHLHRDAERYLGFVFANAAEVAVPQAGDIAVFRFGRAYAHGGIVTQADRLVIVHAYQPARRVTEEEVAHNAQLCEASRKPRYFSIWAKSSRGAREPAIAP
jgi:hypothetical protein